MFDLKNIQMGFIDFDDTILLRRDRSPNKDYYKRMVEGDWTFFNNPKRAVGRGIESFVKSCRMNGVKLYVLTWCYSNLCYKAEKGWLDFKFGEGAFKDVLIASSREYKIEIMSQFASAYDISEDHILFVDDVPEITDLAFRKGFQVASPQEIALLYD